MTSVQREKTFQSTVRDIKRRLSDLETSTPLNSASIGSGGLTVRDEGSIHIEDGGTFQADHSAADGGGPAIVIGLDEALVYALRLFNPAGQEVLSASAETGQEEFTTLMDFVSLIARIVQLAYHGDESFDASVRVGESASAPGVPGIALETTQRIDLIGDLGTFILHAETGLAANCHINTSGLISRSTSSRRYKQDITTEVVDVDTALRLQPRRFRMRREVAQLGRDAPTYVGFIAEEAAALGLTDWVEQDADGPESFSYGSWVVAQQAILQKQQQDIADLRAEVALLREAVQSTSGGS